MIKVRFFGEARLKTGVGAAVFDANRIDALIKEVSSRFPVLSEKDLKNFLIYVNGEGIQKLRMFRTLLSEGDEVLFLSPASGG